MKPKAIIEVTIINPRPDAMTELFDQMNLLDVDNREQTFSEHSDLKSLALQGFYIIHIG